MVHGGRFAAVVVTAAALLGGSGAITAAEPDVPADLAKLVPPSVVTFIRVKEPGRLWEDLKKSPFAARLKTTGTWQNFLASDDYLKMVKARDELQRLYDFDIERALKEALGGELVFVQALEARTDGTQDTYFYLLMARAVSAKRLAEVAEKLRFMRTEGGELKQSVEHPYRGFTIYDEVSVPKHGKDAGKEKRTYYCIADAVLLAGERMGPVKAAIDRILDPDKPDLAGSPRYAKALKSLPPGCAVTAYVDAAALVEKARVVERARDERKNPALRKMLGGARALVQAFDAGAVGIKADEGLQAFVRIGLDADKKDAATMELLAGKAVAHEVWGALPPNTVLAVTSRTDLGAVVRLARSRMLEPKAAAQFEAIKSSLSGAFGGVDFETDVLPQFGPEVGLVVTHEAVPAGAKASKHVRGLAATLLIQTSDDGDAATRATAALGMLAWGAVTGNNRDPKKPKLVLRVEPAGGINITYIDFAEAHPLKGVLSPCFTRIGSYLAVSTSRAALRDVIKASGGKMPVAGSAVLRRHLERAGGKANAMLFIDAAQLAAVMRDNLDLMVAGEVKKKGIDAAEAKRNLTALGEVVELLEGLSIVKTVSPEQVSVTMTVTTSEAGAP